MKEIEHLIQLTKRPLQNSSHAPLTPLRLTSYLGASSEKQPFTLEAQIKKNQRRKEVSVA
jgi:hypothetical protein